MSREILHRDTLQGINFVCKKNRKGLVCNNNKILALIGDVNLMEKNKHNLVER